MKIVVVDDDKGFARDMGELLRSEGHDSTIFHSVEEARKGLAGEERPFLMFLDHDFGPAEQGYELARWLRETHPFGMILPIIYLTGSESPERFLGQESATPFAHPTAFLTKNQLAKDDGLLSRLLKQYAADFERVRELVEIQATRQALQGLGAFDPEVIDAP